MNERLLRKALKLYQNDIFRFVRDEFGVSPTKQQAALLKNIQEGKSVSIRSGHGTGKSASLSWVLLWFLLTKPYSKIVATAPTRRQLRDVLWAEAKMWRNRSTLCKALIVPQAETFRVLGSDSWFARAVSINTKDSPDQQAETLAGYHAPHLLVIVDEASGVPDPVYRPLEGMLTTNTQIVLAGNPTRTGNYFHRTHTDPFFGKFYARLWWNSEESENVSKQWIQDMKEKYGEGSAIYRIRVRGEFVEQDGSSLISDSQLYEVLIRDTEQCRATRQQEAGYVIGIDTAKLNDNVAIAFRELQCITSVKVVEPSDISKIICSRVFEALRDVDNIYSIAVDTTGGYGDVLFDCLKQKFGRIVYPVNFSWKAKQSNKYVLFRDEMYGTLFEYIAQKELFLPDDPALIRQLLATAKHFQYDEKLRIKLKPKSDLKNRLGESPDLADAVALTMTEPLLYGGEKKWSSSTIRHRKTRTQSWILR